MGIFLAVLILITIGSIGAFFYLTGEPLPTSLESIQGLLLFEDKNAIRINDNRSVVIPNKKTVVLAGTTSQLLEFRKEDYLEAVEEEKIIFFYTTTNLCFICRDELNIIKKVFNETDHANITGFRINLGNNGKDAFQKKIISTFDISSENTKVFIKNAVRLQKSTETWDENRYLLEIGDLQRR